MFNNSKKLVNLKEPTFFSKAFIILIKKRKKLDLKYIKPLLKKE